MRILDFSRGESVVFILFCLGLFTFVIGIALLKITYECLKWLILKAHTTLMRPFDKLPT